MDYIQISSIEYIIIWKALGFENLIFLFLFYLNIREIYAYILNVSSFQ